MNQLKVLFHPHKIETIQAAQSLIKKALCRQNNPDCFCPTCFAITKQTHPSVIWIPAKTSYTKEDLAPLTMLTSHQRSALDQLFFVLENPEYLLHGAANSLLKVLEEPPAGAHFLFLSQNTAEILPTILSRAQLIALSNASSGQNSDAHPLIQLTLAACTKKEWKVAHLDAILQKDSPDHQRSAALVDEIIRQLTVEGGFEGHLATLYELRSTPPAPGSSKLFWRTLFMRIGLL